MKYDKNIMNSLQEAYKSISEGDDHEGKKLGDVEKAKYDEKLKKVSKKAPIPTNKIVPMKTRTEEAIKMSRKEYNNTHKDFKSDNPKNPRVTRYVPGKGTVSTPVKITDEVDKKKEMEDKMKEVEDMRSLPTRMNLIKTKLRAMGLNMSHVLKGNELSEVTEFTISELNRYGKETGKATGSMNKPEGSPVKTGGNRDDKALLAVRGMIRKDTGRPEGQLKKTKGEKGRVQPGDRKGLDYKTRVANRRESERTKDDAMMDTKGT